MLYVIHTADDGSKTFRSYSGMTEEAVNEVSGHYAGTFELVDEATYTAAAQAHLEAEEATFNAKRAKG